MRLSESGIFLELELYGEKLNIHYIDEGAGDAILLLHGWGARGETYRCIIDMLTPYFRVIAPDMPGFGASAEPSFAYDSEHYAGFVNAFLQKLGIESASLIGHSHGGRTALFFAADEKRTIRIPKMVLFDSAGLIRKKSLKQKLKIFRYKVAKKMFGNSLVKRLLPDLLETMRKKNGSADYAAASPIMRQSMVKVIHESVRSRLSQIKVPTLLIWGEEDTDTPLSHAYILQKELPDCGLVKIPSGNHFSFLSDPLLVRRVLYSFFDIIE